MEPRPTQPEKEISSDLDRLDISRADDDLYNSDDSFPDIECDICRKEFSSVRTYEQHLNSKKHHQMLAKRKTMQKVAKMTKNNGVVPLSPDDDPDEDDPDEELSCEVCSKSFSGCIPYAAHLKSSGHNKNLKTRSLRDQLKDLPEVVDHGDQCDEDDVLLKPFAHCAPCGKVFYGPSSFQQHMKGSQHKKKMQNRKTLESLKSPDDSEKLDDEDDDDDFFTKCDVCGKCFSGPVPYKIHLHSASHQKELKRTQMESELKDLFTKDTESQRLVCKECGKPFTDPFAFKNHLDNNSHGKKKAKDEVFDFVAAYPEIAGVKSVQNLSDDETEDGGDYRNGAYFFVCKLCHLSFSGPESVRDHVRSKKHIQTKKDKEERKKLQRKIKEKSNGVKESNGVNGSADAAPVNNTNADLPKKVPDVNDEFEFV